MQSTAPAWERAPGATGPWPKGTGPDSGASPGQIWGYWGIKGDPNRRQPGKANRNPRVRTDRNTGQVKEGEQEAFLTPEPRQVRPAEASGQTGGRRLPSLPQTPTASRGNACMGES